LKVIVRSRGYYFRFFPGLLEIQKADGRQWIKVVAVTHSFQNMEL